MSGMMSLKFKVYLSHLSLRAVAPKSSFVYALSGNTVRSVRIVRLIS